MKRLESVYSVLWITGFSLVLIGLAHFGSFTILGANFKDWWIGQFDSRLILLLTVAGCFMVLLAQVKIDWLMGQNRFVETPKANQKVYPPFE